MRLIVILHCIFQLSSLSRHAEDLFGEMIAESTSILNRTVSLQGRVDKLSVKVKNLDSNVEEGNDIMYLNKLSAFLVYLKLKLLYALSVQLYRCIFHILYCSCMQLS